MSKYGLLYQGSKNKIADKIIDLLPPAENFYDLFAGGCAISHRALLSGKYNHIYANDINDMPKLFKDAIDGKYANEDRWISREEFFENIDDPYIKSTWSFGGVGESYIYSRKIEPYKKALWYAVMFDDWTDFEVLMSETVSRCKNALNGVSNKNDRRLALQRELTKYIKENEAEGNHNWQLHPLYSQIKRSTFKGNLLQSLQSLERLDSMKKINILNASIFTISKKSYEEVPILPNSVIYCDIPYFCTTGYNKSDFDYDKFYEWALKQTSPVYISEYWMPEDRFECVMDIEVVRKASPTKSAKITEKLFVPKK